jgi:hypothetical protein
MPVVDGKCSCPGKQVFSYGGLCLDFCPPVGYFLDVTTNSCERWCPIGT